MDSINDIKREGTEMAQRKGNDIRDISYRSVIESLLFVSGEPVEVKKIASVLDMPINWCKEILRDMMIDYNVKSRGIHLIQVNTSYQFVTNSITKGEIDAIRGVKSDKPLQTLIDRELVEERGRLKKIGTPIIYGTSESFLKAFGFSNLRDLPDISDFENFNLFVGSDEIKDSEERIEKSKAVEESKKIEQVESIENNITMEESGKYDEITEISS
jgi:segregation and condensation protein B